MATVNGKDILRAEVEKYYKASLGDNPQEPSTEQANIVRLSILHQLIEDEILQQRAAKLNLALHARGVRQAAEATQHYTRRSEARSTPLADQGKAAEQRDRIQNQHHRFRYQQLLSGT
jgi:hypothetical protein